MTTCEKLPYAFVKKHKVLPLKDHGTFIELAALDRNCHEATDLLKLYFKKDIRVHLLPKAELMQAIKTLYLPQIEASALTHDEDVHAHHDALDPQNDHNAISQLNGLLTEAIEQRASDIHIEPAADKVTIRYRIDGLMYKRHELSLAHYHAIISRLKLIARLNISERRLPQDGKSSISLGDKTVDLRLSFIPLLYGERAVIRLLEKTGTQARLDALGLSPEQYTCLKKLIRKKEGLILTCGPTGCGKTSTLYAIIQELLCESLNIMTIEDPVEYSMDGVSQIAVKEHINMSFSKGLKHILRQDPDIIMIGEIRDKSTAEIAIEAALTGHLVLSSLHTDNAPSAITRLMDMGIAPYLIASTLTATLSQRLVRKICTQCHTINGGCAHCYHTGYKGRTGLYETFIISDSIRTQLSGHLNNKDIYKLALAEGMLPLKQAGHTLIEQGITSQDEVLRVLQ